MKHVIIGGVAGGATAAARIRRADEKAEIIILEKGKYISYANCGLPYYIGGVIEERSKLFLQTPQSFGKRFNIDVRVENEVVGIDPKAKKVSIRRADGTTYAEAYDKLLLSPGATPVRPPLEGIDSEGIFTLRDVNDTDKIKDYLSKHTVRNAVVVGAGFIGLEMAENLHHAGAKVSIVERGNQVMSPIDYSMAAHVHQHLMQKGVDLYLEYDVERFERTDKGVNVFFRTGEMLLADIVILSIGVRPETTLAKQAGIKLGETGGIWVDEYLQTSEEDIYAVGDAIEFPHPITGKPWLNYLANPANRQGRLVADNMVWGKTQKYEGAIGTSIAKVFDMTVASTGLAGKRLKQMEIPYRSSWTHSASHAGYYPNSLPLSIKLTFEPETGRILGGQCVGYDGVDKRIDQIAMLVKRGGTVFDLTEVEHTYAPPFSSAKDPIAIAGYVASNIVTDVMPVLSWRNMRNLSREDYMIIDVRTPEEFSMGSIPGAVNIPVDDLRGRLSEIPKDKPLAVYCAVGLRGYLSLNILRANGYTQVRNLSGGYKTYSTAVAPIKCSEPTSDAGSGDDASGEQRGQAYNIATSKLSMAAAVPSAAGLDQQQTQPMVRTIKLDACGLQCPGPILKLKESIDTLEPGERLEIVATDAGFARDAQAWCNTTGNTLLSNAEDRGKYTVVVEKGQAKECKLVSTCDAKGKTLIMFSDDLDKALATMVLANGAAATGQPVSIFFTFWGLNVIKKVKKPSVQKDIFGRMFGWMLPSSSLKLKLSKMHMMGIGSRMMRSIMKRKGIASLEELRSQALALGVEFIACQMSMDVMGVKREELLDQVTIGGVATYMERADNANVNLFV